MKELNLVVVTAGQYNEPETSWRAPLTVLTRVVTELAKQPGRPGISASALVLPD